MQSASNEEDAMKLCVGLLSLPLALAVLSALQSSQPTTSQPQATEPELAGVSAIQRDAKALRPLVQTDLAIRFLAASADLPSIGSRSIFHNDKRTQWFSSAEAAKLPEDQRKALHERPIDESIYYDTKYGSPLAYSRPIDLLGQSGLTQFSSKRILDFGYGTIGHLGLMASCGADVVGLDVDPFLTALYSEPSDQGAVKTRDGSQGQIRLVNGRFSEDAVRKAVGDGYDLIISKNTLKRGYVHPPPEEHVPQSQMVELDVDDESFIKLMFEMLKPGGRFLIYNLCPKQAAPGQKYIPWADGRCPFDQSLLEKTGFKVIQFDRDDSDAARSMGRVLQWDTSSHPMDLKNDLCDVHAAGKTGSLNHFMTIDPTVGAGAAASSSRSLFP
jgi:SAM-dependent methyltransferase